MKKLRSVLSFLMVLALCLSLVTAAFAAEEEEAAVEEAVVEVAEEAAAEEVALDGAETSYTNVPDGGSYFRRDKNGAYSIEIGDWEDVEELISDGTYNCKSGNLAYIYTDGAGSQQSLTIYAEDIARDYDLHIWGEWTAVEGSCTEGGVSTRTCEVCGKVETQTYPPQGHTWSSEVEGNEYWGEIVEEPSCTAGGKAQDYCIVCGEKRDQYRDVDANGHQYVLKIDKYPTCVANSYDGTKYELTNIEYHFECAVCGEKLSISSDGKSYSDFVMTLETFRAINNADSVYNYVLEERVYQITGNVPAIQRVDSKGELKTLTAPADFVWQIRMEDLYEMEEAFEEGDENGWHGGHETVLYKLAPTCYEPGIAVVHCSVCGYRAEEEVPALHHGFAAEYHYYDYDDTEETYVDYEVEAEIGDTGALQFVRNRLVDCFTQTQDWYCPLCKQTLSGLWYNYDYSYWYGEEEVWHEFVFGATRDVVSHVFDDAVIEIEASRDKKFSIDLTSQNLIDAYIAYQTAKNAAAASGEPGAAVVVDEDHIATFTDLVKTEAAADITGFASIQMPTCDEAGYVVVTCVYIDPDDDDDPHGALPEFVASGTRASADNVGKYTIGVNKDSGEYEIQVSTRGSRDYSWKTADLPAVKIYTIPAYGHQYGSWNTYYTPNQDGNGNLNGYWERVCSICGAVDSVISTVAPAPCEELGLTHRYVELSTEPSTCVQAGKTTFICEICGDTYETELPLIPHTPEAVAEVPATEEAPGVTAGVKCSVCGEILEGCEPIEEVVANVYAINTTGAKIEGSNISGTGKIEKTEGNQPDGKRYVYIVINFVREDGSGWAIAGTYPVDEDGSFDFPEISSVSDTIESVYVTGLDAKVGANFAGHKIAGTSVINP